MQVQNNNPVNFQGTRMNSSRMTRAQINMSEQFINAISYCDSFLNAHEAGVDVYLLPKNKTQIKVRFVDRVSDMFYKTAENAKKRLGFDIDSEYNIMDAADRTDAVLNDIVNNKIACPAFNREAINNAKTEIAMLRPELYESYEEEAKECMVDINFIKQDDGNHFVTLHSEF